MRPLRALRPALGPVACHGRGLIRGSAAGFPGRSGQFHGGDRYVPSETYQRRHRIEYGLTYENLRAAVTQAHIHFAQKNVNGGIVAFLCSNLAPALADQPAGPPPCPTPGGTVTGTVTAAQGINRAAAQGIATGELARLIQAIRGGVPYANVHSTLFPQARFVGRSRGSRMSTSAMARLIVSRGR